MGTAYVLHETKHEGRSSRTLALILPHEIFATRIPEARWEALPHDAAAS
ncbi:uncharacterized protein CMC5_070720 [Chondromyces crocatus]|uniref:Uncharacterized protein n=1 Tax=Chondromyces crocatus TaxID=52 RepID=A0A0K1EPV2_CHOCO|nr:uncharacterized protein CMC5_070720 [Chondromyces crocatus]